MHIHTHAHTGQTGVCIQPPFAPHTELFKISVHGVLNGYALNNEVYSSSLYILKIFTCMNSLPYTGLTISHAQRLHDGKMRRTLLLLRAHLLQDGDDHVKGGPLPWVLVHADPDEFGYVGRDTRWHTHPQTLTCDLLGRRSR